MAGEEFIYPPWDEATVAVLNEWQASPIRPFVCMAARHDHPHGPRPALTAHPDGWHCPEEGCDYRQVWAPVSMTEPPPPEWAG